MRVASPHGNVTDLIQSQPKLLLNQDLAQRRVSSQKFCTEINYQTLNGSIPKLTGRRAKRSHRLSRKSTIYIGCLRAVCNRLQSIFDYLHSIFCFNFPPSLPPNRPNPLFKPWNPLFKRPFKPFHDPLVQFAQFINLILLLNRQNPTF